MYAIVGTVILIVALVGVIVCRTAVGILGTDIAVYKMRKVT